MRCKQDLIHKSVSSGRNHMPLNKNKQNGTFLEVQGLRIHLPMQGTRVQSLVGELRCHMPAGQKRQISKMGMKTVSLPLLTEGLPETGPRKQ